MTSLRLELDGIDRALAWLDADLEHVKHGFEAGLYRSALAIMAMSQREVPVKTGVLRASGTVHLPVWDGNACTVTLGYGGAASAYAERQHEDLFYRHKDGQNAKYLERPLMTYSDTLGNVVAAIQEER